MHRQNYTMHCKMCSCIYRCVVHTGLDLGKIPSEFWKSFGYFFFFLNLWIENRTMTKFQLDTRTLRPHER